MIGLGNVGSGMCYNLLKAGYRVTVFDLNEPALNIAVSRGASGAPSAAAAVREADIVVTKLPAGAHVLSVYFGEGGVVRSAK